MRVRRMLVMLAVPVLGAGSLVVPASVVVAGAAAITAAGAIAAHTPARASSGSVLILSTSVNGGSSSVEAQQASTTLGLTVTVASASAWDSMTTAQFKQYSALVIGDPSAGGSCASSVPSDALSTAGTWGQAVTGNISVLGTAPALGGGTSLIADAIGYAASGSGTGLYVSLNCEYSSAAAGTNVPLLASVDGGGFTVTGQGSSCPGNAGTVNAFQALALSPFNALTPANLGPWSSPACSVQETFGTWPAGLGGLGYLAGASPALFTASDGATGQAYILAGAAASTATAALAPSTGGEVPALAAVGGSNPAAPGVSADTAGDPVDTENGDFSQSNTDFSIPTFGPSLDFSRTYDSALAQQQSVAATPVPSGAPGSLGYGWTDNWDTWLSANRTVPGDIYTIDGTETNTGQGGSATAAAMNHPDGVTQAGGNVYVADTNGNRIEEIPGSSGTQWGIAMTAGDVYTVVGSDTGTAGVSCSNGTAMASCLLDAPQGVTVDSAGDLFVADTGNNRVLEISAVSGTNYGLSMTADDAYTVAGHGTGAAGHGGDGGVANVAFLDAPTQVIHGAGGDTSLFIADEFNSRVQEVYETGGEQWGQSMTANDIYTIAGNSAGTDGNSGDGGSATSALLEEPESVTLSSAGDLYIADTGNDQIREVPKSSGTQWSQSMTGNDIYTVAGHVNGALGLSANGTPGGSSYLAVPTGVVANNGTQLYITDGANYRVAELASTTHSEWGISMTADDLYNIAGSASGQSGYSGNGGLATSALLQVTGPVAFGSSGMYLADGSNNETRFVSDSSFDISDFAGGAGTFAQDGDGGTAVDAGLNGPDGLTSDSHGDIFIADEYGFRVQEIAAYAHTQFGIAMTAGDVYTVAGSAGGYGGSSGDGGPATSALLADPTGVAVDSAGNLYIADYFNNRIQMVSATTGDISTFAGSASGTAGDSGQGGLATSALLTEPFAVATNAAGDVFISGRGTNQVYDVPAASGTNFGIAMTAGHIYTIAGSTSGTSGDSGNGGHATSALLDNPEGVALDSSGNLYVSDSSNNRVQEIAATTHTQWGISMTSNDIYTVAGNASGAQGSSGDEGPATSALLWTPGQIAVDSSGNLYVPDFGNDKVREVAASSGTQWGQQMAVGDIYTVAGTGTRGGTGDGGPAASAELANPGAVSIDPFGDIFLTDTPVNDPTSSHLREVTSNSGPLFATSPAGGSTWTTSGITITQPGGSQITFYPKSGGSCVAPYVLAGSGGYCALPLYADVNLTYSSGGGGTYTYTPSPGLSYTYGSGGALQSETDAAGNTLTVAYGSPAPGSGNCPSTASTCDTITSASGRALVVGYNSASLVTSVTDPMGRQWAYTYTGSDLTKATDPMGNSTSYTYDTSNTNAMLAGDMLTITGPNAQPGGPDAGDDTVNVYDSNGRVTQQTDPMGFVTRFNYCVNATAGNCMNTSTGTGFTTVTDPDGNTTVDNYLAGSLTGTADYTSGTTLASAQTYVPNQASTGTSADTQLDTATQEGNGNITTTTYDSSGNELTSTAPDGVGTQTATTTQAYTALNSSNCSSTAEATGTCAANPGPSPVAPGGTITPPSSAPPEGLTWTLYDTDGNQLYTTTGVYQPGNNSASYSRTTYQLFKNNTITLGSNHVACTAVPPSSSLPCATINPDGVVTQLAYNSAGDLTSNSTPDGNGTELATATYGYDSDGEQTSAVSPDGNLTGANAGNYTTTTAFNNDGQKTTVKQAAGTGHTATTRTANYGYDADGNQITVQDARGFTMTTAYNADDQAALITDPDGNATLTCYDGDGNTVQTVPPVGVAANSLTPASCPTSYPSGYSTRLASDATVDTFDANGNKTQETTPAPAGQSGYETTSYTYDGNGNVLTTTAPPASNGGPDQVTVDAYTATGQIATETTGYGTSVASTLSYCYNPNGDQTGVVYADGNTTGTAPCETSSPWIVSLSSYPTQAGYQTTYSYDSLRELVSTTTPVTAAAPSGATTSSTYDPAGNKLTSTDPNGITTTWTYTPLDEMAAIAYSGSSAHSVSYTYDADGNKTAMTDATGSSSFAWDPFGELSSATNGAGQTTGYGYNADGNVTSITYPLPSSATWATSDTVSYTVDNADQVISATDFNGNRLSIGNTADGLPSSVTLGTSGDTVATTYDNTDTPSLIKLKNSTTTLQTFSYSDAPAENILSETDTPSSSHSPADYTYDAQGRVTSMTPGSGSMLSYGFDASGNLTSLPTGATGTYDNQGELTSAALSGATTSYSYDADGQRLTSKQGTTTIASGTWNGAKELTSYDDSATDMIAATYDAQGLRATETTSTGTQDFVWNLTASVAQLILDSQNAYIYGTSGTPVEQVNLSSGAVSYLVADTLGSTRGIVDSTGTLSGTTGYDVWGNPETAGGLGSFTPFGFAGGYTDPTGLIYLINRYYDPATGQFTSVDPDLAQTLRPYSYAAADPVDQSDPNGLYAVIYHDRCGQHMCLNITKRCGSDNRCGLYFAFKLTYSKWRKAKHVKTLVELWVGATMVLPNSAGPHYPEGDEPGTHVWYGEWGFHIRGHDWGYYCRGLGICYHMGPTDHISLGANGTFQLRGATIEFGAEGEWFRPGKRRPWRHSYIHPAL